MDEGNVDVSPVSGMSRRDLIVAVVVCAVLTVVAFVWYSYVFGVDPSAPQSRTLILVYGLLPCLAAVGLSLVLKRWRFGPVAVTSIVMILASREMLYPYSHDMAFYAGKAIWASLNNYLIDPVIGIDSGYPAAYTGMCGVISKLTGIAPIHLLRYSSCWNLVSYWFALWLITRQAVGARAVWVVLWLGVLVLPTRDYSGILFPAPAPTAMAFAMVGWWYWIASRNLRQSWIGAVALVCAILIAPTHLFGAVGVGIVMGWKKRREWGAWIYAVMIMVAVGAVWLLRMQATGHESWSAMQIAPDNLVEFFIGRVVVFISLGSMEHGWIPSLVAAISLFVWALLALRGSHCSKRPDNRDDIWALVLGLTLGACVAGWFMSQGAQMLRIVCLAATMLAPLATVGLIDLWSNGKVRILRWQRGWLLALGFSWLLPFLLALSVTAEQSKDWAFRVKPATEWMDAHAKRGQRVWATPETYRQVILGRLPLFGFLAHHWPYYYGAPRNAADSIATAYETLRLTHDPARLSSVFRRTGVDWVILDRDSDVMDDPIAKALLDGCSPVLQDPHFLIYNCRVLNPEE